MKEQTKTKVRGWIAAVVVLSVATLVLTIGYIGSTTTMSSYASQLENNYQRSVYELATDLKNIEVNLSKAIVSTGKKTKQNLYQKINTDCNQANEDLSRLPINHESVYMTTQFINEMGGYSYYLNDKLNKGEELTSQDNKSVDELYKTCKYIQSVLNDFMSQYNGRFSILASSKDISNKDNSFNSIFSNMQAEGVEYPTLIYDGPFSQSQVKKDIKGLPKEEVSKEDAKKKIEQIYDSNKYNNLKFEGETEGVFKTYNFTVNDETNRQIYIQVAKRGGFVLTVSSYKKVGKDNLKLVECEKYAKNFAKKLGLDMEAVWSTKISGTAYINLTPIQNGVIIYPDMIKVKVSATDGEILGWEAESYAFNHIVRKDLTSKISENTARSKLDKRLEIESQKLTLIPIEYSNETLCYEYKCSFNNDTYYVYINAKTGVEMKILKIIKTSDGNLLM